MYAVIETGGKQYRVEVGTELEVELLDVEPGKTVTLERVLLVADGDQASIGQPVVGGAAVSAEVVRQIRGDKVIAFKYRPKARRRVKKGHRQDLTVLRISDIVVDGRSAAKVAAVAESDARTERQRLEAAAAAQAAKDAELAAKLAAKAPTAAAPKKAATQRAKAETGDEAPKVEAPRKAAPAKAAAPKAAAPKAAAPKAAAAKAKPPAKADTAKADAAKADSTKAKAANKPADTETPAKPRATKRTTKKDE
jgi:large subunit ribosomal protein L21